MIQLETLNVNDESLRCPSLDISDYRPNVTIELETRGCTIHTARNGQELQEALRLRHQVFYQELLGFSHPLGLDVDSYDLSFDHIILRDKKSGKAIGTYRLNCSLFNSHCYSEGEFDCRNLHKLLAVRLELGRACLDADYRSGAHFILLWRGILAYAQATDSRYLYGCASVKTMDTMTLARIHRELDSAYGCPPRWSMPPRTGFAIPGFSELKRNLLPASDGEDPLKKIPSLLWFYFKAGARLCGEPAIDTDFQCADFPILFDLHQSRHPLKKKISE